MRIRGTLRKKKKIAESKRFPREKKRRSELEGATAKPPSDTLRQANQISLLLLQRAGSSARLLLPAGATLRACPMTHCSLLGVEQKVFHNLFLLFFLFFFWSSIRRQVIARATSQLPPACSSFLFSLSATNPVQICRVLRNSSRLEISAVARSLQHARQDPDDVSNAGKV